MKIIDEQARLSGKACLFDIFVLCVITASALFAVQWFRIGEDPAWVKVKVVRVRCIAETEVSTALSERIKEKDILRDNDGLVLVEIEKILNNDPVIEEYVSAEGEKISISRNNRKLTFLLDMLAYEKGGKVYSCFTNLPLKKGERFAMTTEYYSFPAFVKNVLPGYKTVEKGL